eukprot:TRINITY_DN48701_c0_g1_i1.p3 TRINITY_DN48701_c0_g1~~TRINITY_DN48701_c0_g1_i1.p3  ORF type:complete len:112 (-),score=2.91 TRINITY_DN48701_c0_g1_i1:79-414(-)
MFTYLWLEKILSSLHKYFPIVVDGLVVGEFLTSGFNKVRTYPSCFLDTHMKYKYVQEIGYQSTQEFGSFFQLLGTFRKVEKWDVEKQIKYRCENNCIYLDIHIDILEFFVC